MASLSIPNSFSNGTPADALQVNANFNAVKSFVESQLVQVDGSVKATTSSIDESAVTATKIAANAVTEAKIASGAVTESKIGSAAVTDAKVSLTPASGVVKVYASTTARDTAITSPAAGMVVYVDSGDASEGLYTYQGAAWRKGPGWNAPWGVVDLTYSSTIDGNPNTAERTAITSGTFTAVANRYYRIQYFEPDIYVSAACMVTARIKTSGGTIIQYSNQDYQINDNIALFLPIVTTLTAGATTLVATLQVSAGATQQTRAATTRAFLLVEDIGPAGAPA